MTKPPRRPIVRYHGGKWLLAPWIISNLPPHRTYTESYGGGASVLLRKPRSYAEIYNDLDGEIVNVFRVVQQHRRRLMQLLMRTPYARAEYSLSFKRCDDPVEQARRTIVRSFMGYGSNSLNRKVKSGFRANSQRSGTTAAHDWMGYPTVLRLIERRLCGVVIENKHAHDIINHHDSKTTLHYVDPSYVHSTRATRVSGGAHGYTHELSDADHECLAEKLHGLDGMVVLSGYRSPLYDHLYTDWETMERRAYGDGGCVRTEVLWFNATATEGLNRLLWPRGGCR